MMKNYEPKKILHTLSKERKENWGRFLDNHYNGELHSKTFFVARKAPDHKHYYNGHGLSCKFTGQKLVLQNPNTEDQGKDKGKFIRFPEFDYIEQGQIMISIEYWQVGNLSHLFSYNTNQSQMSTRHNPEKYQAFAKRIKQAILQKYPNTKVIIKPGSSNQDEKIHKFNVPPKGKQSAYTQEVMDLTLYKENNRMGAFEVQIYKRNYDDSYYQSILHSKLISKEWPSIPKILEQLSDQQPKCNLCITVYDQTDEDDRYLDRLIGLDVKVVNKFKGTAAQNELQKEVRQMDEQEKNNQSVQRRQRPTSAASHRPYATFYEDNQFLRNSFDNGKKQRPTSAKTVTGGFGGRSRSRPLSGVRRSGSSNKVALVKDFERNGTTNDKGQVLCAGVPMGVYEITVKGSDHYKQETIIYNAFEDAQLQSTYNIYVALRSNQTAITKIRPFTIVHKKQPQRNPETNELEYIAVEIQEVNKNAFVRAMVLELENEDDLEDQDYELVYNEDIDSYEATLPSGRYMLAITCPGKEEINLPLDVGQGPNTLNIQLEPETAQQNQIYVIDALTGKAINKALVKVFDMAGQGIDTKLSQRNGGTTFNFKGFEKRSIRVEKDGYLLQEKDFYSQYFNAIYVFMIPDQEPESDRQNDEGEEVTEVKLCLSSDSEFHFDLMKYHGTDEEKLIPSTKDQFHRYYAMEVAGTEWVRLVAYNVNIIDQQNKEVEVNVDDKNFLTLGQAMNVLVQIIIDNEIISNVYLPSGLDGDNNHWDLGFVNPKTKDFIETNSMMCSKPVSRKQHLDEIIELFKFLAKNPNVNIKRMFGFNSHGNYLLDDCVMKLEDFVEVFVGLPFMAEEEQRGKKPEELRDFAAYLGRSYFNKFEQVSLKKVIKNLSPYMTPAAPPQGQSQNTAAAAALSTGFSICKSSPRKTSPLKR